MGDIGPALVVAAWVANFCGGRKERRMNEYKDAQNLLFFRPAEQTDLAHIIRLEVTCP